LIPYEQNSTQLDDIAGRATYTLEIDAPCKYYDSASRSAL